MMDFRIADTFTDSLARLTGDEQKAVKTTAFDLQMNSANPGMSFHKLDRARDPNFWSVRVSSDIRLIVHKTAASLLLCYVDHHDKAYQWAERRKLETHPKTGAAQLVEIRERIEEIAVPQYLEHAPVAWEQPRLFDGFGREQLLAYGVPVEWLDDVLVATEGTIFHLADHLPAEAAEALLELATGGVPKKPTPADVRSVQPGSEYGEAHCIRLFEADELTDFDFHALPSIDGGTLCEPPPSVEIESGPDVSIIAFEHPDAQRRFRSIRNLEELTRALDYPWDKWTIFLHPAQREWVEKNYSGPARVSGSAGTGKTIVALHRAVHLARANPEGRILLATFSDTLAHALRTKLRRLISNTPMLGERIEVHAMNAIGERLYELQFSRPRLATKEEIRGLLDTASAAHPEHRFSASFLLSEWQDVVDAWQLDSWESYRDVQRLGRKTRLPEARRALAWSIYEDVRAELQQRGWTTRAGMFGRLADELPSRRHPPFDFAVIDEAQDINVAQLKFLAALGADRPNALFFAGDLGQRIFQQPFSWKSLGVEIRGRSRTLHINYRTSHQIRMQADRLLAPEVSDVDGNVEERRGTVSVFNGPAPTVSAFPSADAESAAVGDWLRQRIEDGIALQELGVFVRSAAELDRARNALASADLPFKVLDDHTQTTPGHVSLCTMHLAKGLEFRAVAVMACDDEVVPLQQRIESVTDDADLEEVYNTERHLLYVACTRARDHLMVSGVEPVSEFIDDLVGA